MSDAEALLLVVIIIYLMECAAWVARSAVPQRGLWAARCRPLGTAALFGNDHGAVVLKNPLPPFGTLFVTQGPLISIGVEGVASFVLTAANPGKRPPQPGMYVRFDEISKLETDGRRVLINGADFVSGPTARAAGSLAEFIQTLRRAARDRRAKMIEGWLARQFDAGAAQRRYRDWSSESRMLRLLSVLLFGHIFAVTPLVILGVGLYLTWVWLLVILLGLLGMTVVEFYFAHRALFPAERTERRGQMAHLMLLPLAMMRSGDALARYVLLPFHPLVAAQVAGSTQTFRAWAETVWRDLQHPTEMQGLPDAADLRETVIEFHGRLRRVAEGFLRQQGLNLDEIAAPLTADSPQSRSYCPRCHTQFVIGEGTCKPCGGVGLLPTSPGGAQST